MENSFSTKRSSLFAPLPHDLIGGCNGNKKHKKVQRKRHQSPSWPDILKAKQETYRFSRSPSPSLSLSILRRVPKKLDTYSTRKNNDRPLHREISRTLKEEEKNSTDFRTSFQSTPPEEPAKFKLIGPLSTKDFSCPLIQSITEIEKNCQSPIYEWTTSFNKTPANYCTPLFKADCRRPCTVNSFNAQTTNVKVIQNLLHELLNTMKVPDATVASMESSQSDNTELELAAGAASVITEDFKTESIEDLLYEAILLRDTHVRLVQKELQHIERLNRALDKVLTMRYLN